MKKTISFLLIALLAIGCFPLSPAYAAGEEELLSAVNVTASASTLLPGEEAQLTVIPLVGAEQPFIGDVDVTYTSINPYVATVGGSGLVTALHAGVTRVIVTAQGPHNMVSKTVTLTVTASAVPFDGLTFEGMEVGYPPTGSGILGSHLTTVTDAKGKDSGRSAYVNDTDSTVAYLHYTTAASETLTLDFDVYQERELGAVALKILNGSTHNAVSTAFWIQFAWNKTNFYDGSKYHELGTTTLPTGQWASVHIEITNTGVNAGAVVYINGVRVQNAAFTKAMKTTNGTSADTVVNGVYFVSSGGSSTSDSFYIDNLKLKGGITPLPNAPKLTVQPGGLFDLASNQERVLDDNGDNIEADYIIEDWEDGYGWCQIPFAFAPSAMDKVYVNYSRHRDVVMDGPYDSVKIFDPGTLLSAADGANLLNQYTSMKTDQDLLLMSMTELPDGRLFAQNFFPYYIDNSTAQTSGWIIDADGSWTKVTGTLSLPDMGVTAPQAGSTWFPYVFSKGAELLPDGTLLHTMYGLNKALLVQSKDLGQTWTLRSVIAENDGTHINTDGTSIKYHEPSLQRCKDGSLLSIIRTDSNKPLYQSRSYDDGETWSRPILLPGVSPNDARSIYPQTVLLDNGVLALTTGRPNNTLLFSLDGSGYRWGYVTTTYAPATGHITSGNSGLAQIAPNKLLVVGDKGFTQDKPAGIWGRVVEVTRNTAPDPVLDSAILRGGHQSLLALGDTLTLNMDGIFDSNGDLIRADKCEIRYYSESPELASVDPVSGLVTALAAGPVRFIASVTHRDDGRTILSNALELRMADVEELFDTLPAIDRWLLEPGESAQITPAAFNRFGDKIGGASWSYGSSDETVLTVDSGGRVEAVGPGVAQVVVTARKDSYTVVREVAVIVDSNLWTIQDFESSAAGGAFPAGFASTPGGSISDAQAYSGTKSLYIEDLITDAALNATGSFPAAKGVVIEFMLYPEKLEHGISIGIGATGTAFANDSCFFNFLIAPVGSDVLRVGAYDGTAISVVSVNSGVRMKTWNRVRVEATVDKPARLYLNGRFIAQLPVVASQENISRIRFTTGGGAYINDFYYIDDFKVMTFGDSSEALSLRTLMFGGQTVGGFDPDKTSYTIRAPYSQQNALLTAAAAPGVSVAIDQSADFALITVRKGNTVKQYTVSFEWYQPDSPSTPTTPPEPAPPTAQFAESAKSLPYIEGYPDNSFRPEQHTTRAELAQMLYRLTEFKNASETSAGFGDVPSDMWAAQAINALAGLDILPGENGSFKPDQPVTRSQAMRAIALLMGKAPAGSSSFADSQGHPYEGYLAAMEAAGIAKGYPDGTLRLDAPLTRAEMVTLINRALGKAPAATSSTFTDLSAEHWAAGDILAATGG